MNQRPCDCGQTGGCHKCNALIAPPYYPQIGKIVSPPQSGWTCPKCVRVYGPFVSECAPCNYLINLKGVGTSQ